MINKEMTKADKGVVASNVKGFMALPSTQNRVKELLGSRSGNFMTSVSSMVGSDDKLAKCEPVSLFMACLTAAAMDLTISRNLGFAHIIPYENNKRVVDSETGEVSWVKVLEAQFQMGWRGYVQLAQRTGQYKTIAAAPVYEGQLVEEDPLEGNTYDWKAKSGDEVIGYVARFTMLNGFRKEIYMSAEEVREHAIRYSKAFAYDVKNNKTSSPWSNNFEAMALKTVLKMLISKWGIMSVDIQKAVSLDSAVIKEDGSPSYIDGELADDDVKAGEDKKAAIVAANREEAEATASEPVEAKADNSSKDGSTATEPAQTTLVNTEAKKNKKAVDKVFGPK
jgi:recombination protein RecT